MTYSCPVCGGDCNTYLRCYRPDCPDGHDQPGIYYPPTTTTTKSKWFPFILGMSIGVQIGLILGYIFS